MADANAKLVQALAIIYPNVGNTTDLTTRLARKLAQDRQLSTSDATLWDGKDETPKLRTYINSLPDF